MLESEIFNRYTQDYLNILQAGTNAIRKTEHYITLCVITVILMAASPLAHWNEKWFFIDMWLPFDPRSSWFYYSFVHFYYCIGKCIFKLLLC